MAKKGTRKSGIFGKVYSPIRHLLMATRNVSKSVFRRSGRVVDNGLGLVQNVGTAATKHANMTVKNITKSRKNRRSNRNQNKSRRNRNNNRNN
jgi:hypothetical protein